MLIAQALGEYGAMAALSEGIRSGSAYAEELGREWGWTGVGIAIAVALVWKLFTRVK